VSRESGRVQSVERAAALLRAVAAASGPSASATSLAQAVGLNRTTAWRILSTLEQQRLVTLDPDTGWYSLGFGLVDLAGQASDTSLARASNGLLQRMAVQTGETAGLAVLRDGALTYVAESVGGAAVSVSWRGRSVPLHATSAGKALLAYSRPHEVEALLGRPRRGRLPRFTPATITSRAALAEELARSRERGFSVCRGELEEQAWGVSAPVFDVAGRPVALLNLWGPPDRVTAGRFDELGALAIAGAVELAGRRTSAGE
jgi:DNA-binding IclR family transcriptional regulator